MSTISSAHTDAQLGILLERAGRLGAKDQGGLDFEVAARTHSVDATAGHRELLLLDHFIALVRDRWPPQMRGRGGDRGDAPVSHGFGGMAIGQLHEQRVFDQC